MSSLNDQIKDVVINPDSGTTFAEYLDKLPQNQKSSVWSSVRKLVDARTYVSGQKPAEAKTALAASIEMYLALPESAIVSRPHMRSVVDAIDRTIIQAIANERAGQRGMRAA